MEGLHTFGYLFGGFKAIGLVTSELEETRRFLRRHRGHRLGLWMEGDDDEEDTWHGAEDEARAEEGESASFDAGTYRLRCSCGETARASVVGGVRRFKAFIVRAKDLRALRERVVQALDDDFHRIDHPLLAPHKDPLRFALFLEAHVEHGVVAELDELENWSAIEPGQARPADASPLVHAFCSGPETGVRPRLTLSPPLRHKWTFAGDTHTFPTPFADGVIASRLDPDQTLCLDLEGQVRWTLPGRSWPWFVGEVLWLVQEGPEPHETLLLRPDPLTRPGSRDLEVEPLALAGARRPGFRRDGAHLLRPGEAARFRPSWRSAFGP